MDIGRPEVIERPYYSGLFGHLPEVVWCIKSIEVSPDERNPGLDEPRVIVTLEETKRYYDFFGTWWQKLIGSAPYNLLTLTEEKTRRFVGSGTVWRYLCTMASYREHEDRLSEAYERWAFDRRVAMNAEEGKSNAS